MKKLFISSILLTLFSSNLVFANKGDDGPSAGTFSIKNVSDHWRYQSELISAFSYLYKDIPLGGHHHDIVAIYRLQAKNGHHDESRFEVFQTFGDCGSSTFIITDLEQKRRLLNGAFITLRDGEVRKYYSDSPRVYYIDKYSTWIKEECGERPYQSRHVRTGFGEEVSRDLESFENFINEKFINEEGQIDKAFKPFCEQFSRKDEACIKPSDLGDLGA